MKKLLGIFLALFAWSAIAMVNPKEAYQEVLDGKAVMIDVREEDEIKSGMIKEAKWFPLSRIKEDKNWKSDFNKLTDQKKIYLYCRTGNRSGQVQEILKETKTESSNVGGYIELSKILPTTISK